jgi:hypothetical protein
MSDSIATNNKFTIVAIATTAGVGGIRIINDNVSIKSQHYHQKYIARK